MKAVLSLVISNMHSTAMFSQNLLALYQLYYSASFSLSFKPLYVRSQWAELVNEGGYYR